VTDVAANIINHHYGKTAVRVTKVTRLPDRHELVELSVNVRLGGGAFARSYTHGDNAAVIATDSMKNTVYLLAKQHPLDSAEAFALHVAEHFVGTYQQVTTADVEIDQSAWRRIDVGGRPHPTAFESAGAEVRQACVTVNRGGHGPRVNGGLAGLLVLKTTDSAFVGFVRDRYTTLPETTDRILATEVSARWTFKAAGANYNATFATVRGALLETFARHDSAAVQQTLYAMGDAALAAAPAVHSIHLRMPNKHRVPFNFKPFGLAFENDVYVTTDEPSGEISATLQRE
jgi:urate oxidase